MSAAHTIPTRIDLELFESAKKQGAKLSRSAAQQLAHWARLGRALESSPGVDHRQVQKILAGQLSYDDATEKTQAVVREEWDSRISGLIAELDLTPLLARNHHGWVEADANGNLVKREAA